MSSQGDPESEAALRLRITQITTSMVAPLHQLRNLYTPPSLPSAVPPGLLPSQVPVLRIFGTTPQNQKVCANIHLCYPYFFVPFPMDSLDPLRPERVIRLCQRFAVSLNHAICLALRQSPTGPTNAANFAGGTDPKHLHVVSVMLVKGTPFYGYHLGYSYFLKVSLANPSRTRIAVEQLHKPVVLGREWQPHEAHLSHVLQFMCDFDLYGCGFLDLSGGTFREPLPEPGSSQEGECSLTVNSFTVPEDMVYPMGLSPARDTHCGLEIDVLPHQVMNRNRLQPRPLHHDFVELLHSPLDPEEKLVPAMKELWEDERRRRSAKGLATSESIMLPVSGGGRGRTLEELGYKVEGQEVDNKGGDWKISEELWDYISLRMANERKKRGGLSFNRVSKDLRTGANGERTKYDKWVLTAFEAVSAHWPKPFRPKPTQRSVKQSSVFQRSSSAIPSSSPPLPSSPPVQELEEEEDNPFDILATQASQDVPAEAEVDSDAVQVVGDDDDDDPDQQQHMEAVRLRAEEGQRIRATQAVAEDADDEELDEMFRQAIKGEEKTPTRSRSQTPSSVGTMSTGRRRERRLRKLTEQAGFGDLSVIMDESFTLSSPTQNPFADPQTPTKQIRTQVPPANGSQAISSSLVRRSFGSRSRTARPASPSPSKPTPNALVLTESKRSVTHWTPSPQSPTPKARRKVLTPSADEPLSEIKVEQSSSQKPPPNAQCKPAASMLPPPTATTLRMLSATLPNTSRSTGSTDSPTASKRPLTSMLLRDDSSGSKGSPSSGERISRPKKRVRVSSPAPQPSLSVPNGSGSSGGPELSSTSWEFAPRPPTLRDVVDTMTKEGVEPVEYRDPFYSAPEDVPPRSKLFAGRAFRLKGNDVQELRPFAYSTETIGTNSWLKTRQLERPTSEFGWEYALVPPPYRSVVEYCHAKDKEVAAAMASAAASQLARPTQKNMYGFKFTQKKSEREQRNMSVLSIEVFAPSRHQLKPDPAKDEIAAVFYCFQNDMESLPDTTKHPGYYAGYVLVDGPQIAEHRARLPDVPCHVVETELDLINWVIDAVKEWDPDVLTGWELHNASWGYLAARAAESFDLELTRELSRMVSDTKQNRKDGYSAHHTSTFKVNGRHTLNIWRIMRGEVNLNSYSFENVVFHVLHRRVPRYSAANLTALWRSKSPEHTARVLHTMFERVVIYAEVMDTAEIISKNAEFARVFGVDFDAVVFRGSQFKVESFLFRLAKPESFIMVTPSKQQVGLQNAPFAVPLIHEPESKYYSHPIIVLDFQSLYPSVMIAYNICYSTCLGRVEQFKGTNKFGFTELKVPDGLLELLKDYLTVTPNGMIFVKPAVRKSLLAKMLGEILDTRVMVKQAMKGYRGNKSLTQMLNARQLGLKLMANVTYGYTSATYSGRMPCIEIADSIVQTGRETLEKAQELINSTAEWDATVVYGDTDSLFVALPGRSKDEAFKIGHDIADKVTALNPKPVKLKFEKVYMGSVLMAKKRYVGFKYEHPDDVEPVFDAKGIETIRRDGFPAQQKIEEIALKMLFKNQDLSEIKAFVQDEWRKILTGRVSLQDFIVAKEVRLGTYSEKGVPPPGAAVAYRRILKDPRDEVEYGERVPYIISDSSTGGKRLIDKARTPEEMLSSSLGIDKEYYIRNLLIPPLSRIFNLVGADVEQWFDSMPRSKRVATYGANGGGSSARTTRIDAHFRSRHCLVCGAESGDALCAACRAEPAATAHALLSRQHAAHARVADLQRICASCAGTAPAERVLCDSIDCPTLYARSRAEKDVADVADVPALVAELDGQDTTVDLDW